MKIRKFLYKDLQLRKNFLKLEYTLLVLKALALNKILPFSIRNSIFNLINLYTVKSTRIRNRCLYTGRGRGIMTEFKMSRIEFRRFADMGKIPGVRRAS
jgi:small subunit ribosomal protein S14